MKSANSIETINIAQLTPVYRYPEDDLSDPFQFQSESTQVSSTLDTSEKSVSQRLDATQQSMDLKQIDKRISLQVERITIREVLKLLSEYGHVNMVVSDSVSGHVTVRLDDVLWRQALEVILMTRGLAKRQVGNVLLIDTAANLIQRDGEFIKAREQEPIRTELIQIKHVKASDLAVLIKDKTNAMLSAQGSAGVDNKTNIIMLQDKPSYLQQIKQIIRRLDVPIQQVMIEARIVNMSKDSSRDLGIRFGLSKGSSLSGSLQGLNALEPGARWSSVPLRDRLNVDLSATPINANPASIGIALAKLGDHALLDLELSALEHEGRAKIVASPRLMTTNQQTAIIESGEDIPYQETTLSGTSAVAFRKAALSLKVTPQVTPDGKLLMDLKINQDTDSGRRVQGVPIVLTKSIETNVLVHNGQTIVLGGIYKQGKHRGVSRVPLVSALPGLGNLLGNKQDQVSDEELLIFITPRIIANKL